MQDPTFAFEHSEAHRRLIGQMSPLTRFSALPYILSPGANNSDMWHRNHQQAHNDSQNTLAGQLGGTGFGEQDNFSLSRPPPAPQTTLTQLGPGFNIEDYDLTLFPQRTWWIWQNHQAHLDAESTQPANLQGFVFPFT